jgi:hypothetical protein
MRMLVALAILAGTSLTALADTAPLIVVPGRAGVPVIINGRDVSYSVLEGEWGLAKSFRNPARVFGGWDRSLGPKVGHYYPSSGRTPGYGRLEIQPPANRPLPQPAESHYRSWSAQSAPPAPPMLQQEIPYDPPPVIVAPRVDGPHGPGRFDEFRK